MNKVIENLKKEIAASLKAFGKGSLRTNATQLFNTLGYTSEKTIELSPNTPENFLHEIDQHNLLRKEKALFSKWKSVDFIFQITGEEIKAGGSGQFSLQFNAHQKIDNRIIESYLFIAIKLRKDHYTRTDLSTITREINKLFPMPVLILFQNGDTLTLSVINRRLHKRDKSRDVLEKVTLIKDIRFDDPHRAHIEILFDLSFVNLYDRHRFSNFVALHDVWQKALDSSELNKRFFREMANWYFWAVKEARFPSQNEIKDEEIRNATNVIRLVTRLIFVWFVKEKGLIPEALFNEKNLREDVLKDLSPGKITFYKGILQNLFFATLNQEMNTSKKPDNRKFRGKRKKAGSRDQHYMIPNVYRYENYFKNTDRAIRIFESIPFLNGGIFECLDRDETKPVIRIDGFSDRPDNELHVPNYLFFSGVQPVDLNKDYGTRNKTYKVRGLIDILQSYKFTITENTPIEEEIALDPELLGKVFENLLASYNPETGTTARKQTGSFYTPREIVNYMVDESLKASLSNLVAEKLTDCTEEDMGTGLDILFAYTEKDHAFNDEEVSKIVEAVSEIKILDPACGSGAFPMGVLHKLVYILGKLDPDNTQWKELQKQRAIEETEEAYNMGNKEERHQRIVEIEKAFDFNTSDYGRKLYLIENCIYGIDIQPIAVQIAKLRFFISLVVDQKINDTQENRGILPLPNLETKFVAANTLIGIEKGGKQRLIGFDDLKIKKLQNELARIRHKHFNSRTTQTKRKCRENDKEIREKVKNRLIVLYEKELKRRIKNSSEQKELEYYQSMIEKFENDKNKRTEYEQKRQNALEKIEKIKREFSTGTNKVAQQLASWDPYDQNASADFFDSDWMFNITDDFDVVIGNPPYVRQEKIKELKPILKEQYECFTSMADLYVYFYERGFQTLKAGGILTYISSNKYFRSGYGKNLRKFLTSQATVHQLIDFGDAPVFTSIAYPSIITLSKTNPDKNKTRALTWDPGPPIKEFVSIFQSDSFIIYQNELTSDGWRLESPEVLRLLDKLRKSGKPLGEYVSGRFYRGILTGLNEAFVVDRVTRDRLIAVHPSSRELLCPFLRGRDVKRWQVDFADQYLIKIESSKNKQHPWYGKSVKDAEKIFAKTYPAIHTRFEDFREKLVKRDDQGQYFWELRSCSYWKKFEQQKIAYPNICKRNEFAWDESGWYTNQKAFIIPKATKYLLGVLNSGIVMWLFTKLLAKLQNGFYEPSTIFMKNFPILNATTKQQAPIVKLVDEILTAMNSDRMAHITPMEAEIDARVAHLYGLTEEEYSFILNETKPPDPFRVAALNFYRDIARGVLK